MQHPSTLTQRQAAILGGVSILVMVAAVIVAIPSTLSLIVEGDAAKTVQNIVNAGSTFRVGVAAWMVIVLCDLIVSLAFYVVLKEVNAGLSLLTAWFRLFYTALLGMLTLLFLAVLLLVGSSKSLVGFSSLQINSLVLFLLTIFRQGWFFALFFFGWR